jgi:hypothetical protein
MFHKKVPTLVFGFFSFRQTYGMNILIITIHMAGIVKLAMIQAFTAHIKMKIKQMVTVLNIGSIISSLKYFI